VAATATEVPLNAQMAHMALSHRTVVLLNRVMAVSLNLNRVYTDKQRINKIAFSSILIATDIGLLILVTGFSLTASYFLISADNFLLIRLA
jgi:uncharacterized membrane protein